MQSELFAVDAGEPLALSERATAAPGGFPDATCLELEFSSRGDRVPAHVLLPRAQGPHPVLILEHGLGGSRRSEYLEVAARWVREGAAVATLDLPLHGDRSSPKMSERLLTSVDRALVAAGSGAQTAPDPVGRILWHEFARQAVIDLRRLTDALASLAALDCNRLVYGGFSLGAILGAVFCAVDERPRAAALALAGGGFGPEEVDPLSYVAAIAPRPCLFLNARRDERIPKSATEALFAAAGEPKQLEWFDATHQTLPGVALKEMWRFARVHLGLGAA